MGQRCRYNIYPVEILSIHLNQVSRQNATIQINQQSYRIPEYHRKLETSPPLLLEEDYNTIVSKSPMDVGRANLFQMDIPNVGPPIACKSYQILLKYQKFIHEEIGLLENA